MTLELKNLARVKAVVIEWQAAAKSFEVQVASDAGTWGVFASALHEPYVREEICVSMPWRCSLAWQFNAMYELHIFVCPGRERRSAGPSQATL